MVSSGALPCQAECPIGHLVLRLFSDPPITELESRIFSSMNRKRKKSKKIRRFLFLSLLNMFTKVYQLPF